LLYITGGGEAMRQETRKITTILMALGTLVFTGTIGYMLLLGIPLIDAVYMTVITATPH
jgi:uncharacterized membrane protein YgdD (TMEM256/DUF423 family)